MARLRSLAERLSRGGMSRTPEITDRDETLIRRGVAAHSLFPRIPCIHTTVKLYHDILLCLNQHSMNSRACETLFSERLFDYRVGRPSRIPGNIITSLEQADFGHPLSDQPRKRGNWLSPGEMLS
jgi:hypothetical protein